MKVRTRNEEVGGGLAVGRLVPHVNEVLACLARRAVIDLFTLIDDADLVEDLVQLLARLVNRDDAGLPADVGGDADGLDELECSRSARIAS